MEKIKSVKVAPVGLAKNRETINELNAGAASIASKDYPEPKTSGIKVRGTGAATKGLMARGPMA
jgi:hypothetical protein